MRFISVDDATRPGGSDLLWHVSPGIDLRLSGLGS